MKRINQLIVLMLVLCVGNVAFAQNKAQRNMRTIEGYLNEHPVKAMKEVIRTLNNTTVAGISEAQKTALVKEVKKNLLLKARAGGQAINKARSVLPTLLDAYEGQIGDASTIADLLLLIATPTQTFTVTPTPTPTTTSTPTATP